MSDHGRMVGDHHDPSGFDHSGPSTNLHGLSTHAKPSRMQQIMDTALKQHDHATVFWPQTEAGKVQQTYRGEWLNDRKHGYGVQLYNGGRLKYEGQWEHGKRSGEGVLWVIDGKKTKKSYIGMWKNDQRHGKGVSIGKNEEYEGEFREAKREGEGEMRYANGDIYNGEWHDGVKSGYGVLRRANGDTYEGYWVADKREGSGSYFWEQSGKVFVGEWCNDQPVSGVYQQAIKNPDEAGDVAVTRTMPSIKLRYPDMVIADMLAATRQNRAVYRILNLPVERLYTDREFEELKALYHEHGVAGNDALAEVGDYIRVFHALDIRDIDEELLLGFLLREDVFPQLVAAQKRAYRGNTSVHQLESLSKMSATGQMIEEGELGLDFTVFARILAVILEVGRNDHGSQ